MAKGTGSTSSKKRNQDMVNRVNGNANGGGDVLTKKPKRTGPRKTVEAIRTSYQGGGLFEETGGYAGTGTKKTIRDRKGNIKKEVIKSGISPENRTIITPNYAEYGSTKGLEKSTRSKKVTKYSKYYGYKTGSKEEKTTHRSPGSGIKKTVVKTTRDRTKDWGEGDTYNKKNKYTGKLKKALRKEKRALNKPGVQYGHLTKTYR